LKEGDQRARDTKARRLPKRFIGVGALHLEAPGGTKKPCLFLALSYGSAALQACLALDNVPTILAAPIDKSGALPSMICRAISSAVSSAMASFVRYDEAHPRACASKRDFLRHVPLASA
jgi:hypothetical protein